MNNIEFRVANFSDVTSIVSLCNLCFEENTNVKEARKIFLETKMDNIIYLIGLVDDKIIAHTRIEIVKTMFKNMNTFAILNHVCVHPDYRRHNLGTRMLEEVKQICLEKNCIAMKLWSMNFRVPAHECYKKFGFHVDDAKFFTYDLTKRSNDYENR